jgi:hypothetical protein
VNEAVDTYPAPELAGFILAPLALMMPLWLTLVIFILAVARYVLRESR